MQFGETQGQGSISTSMDGSGKGSRHFSPQNADALFAEVFGHASGSSSSMNTPASHHLSSEDVFTQFFGTGVVKPSAVETKLPCKLEELYSGASRKLKISREIVKPNGRIGIETEILTINIKPGWKKGTKITFPGKGNEQPNQLPADLVFVIDEKPHDVYTRDGNDLLVYKKIDLVDALAGTTVHLKTLDGRDLGIMIEDVVTPGYELVVAKEGMPIVKEDGRRGNLRIKFDVEFPKRLSAEQRRNIRRDLGGQPQQQ